MKLIYTAVLALTLTATSALAQAADTIEDVIGGQLEAFNNRDVPTAFGFASPMIKRLFGNPGNFGAMVSQGYPMVWDNTDVKFLDMAEIGGVSFQKVLLRGPAGDLHVIVYKMLKTPTGWQIDGVDLLKPDVGA